MFKTSPQTFLLSYCKPTSSAPPLFLSSCPNSSLPLSLFWILLSFHSPMLPSDIALSLLKPLHIIPPPRLCGTGCFTSAVLTLTAPSLWRLISCSDTLSLYHANGPSHPPACVYAISTLSKTPENRERQIRETYTHTHIHRHLSCLVYVCMDNRKVREGEKER